MTGTDDAADPVGGHVEDDVEAGLGLVTIRVRGVPIDVYLRSSEHVDELVREFAYIAAGTADRGGDDVAGVAGSDPEGVGAGHAGVPVRLVALVEELRSRFSGFTLRPEAELAAAAARGDGSVDVEYVVPPSAAPGAAELGDLLDEADDFCRAGDLLTLASPPEAVAFRRWFLDEFVRQAGGLPPTPWADWKP